MDIFILSILTALMMRDHVHSNQNKLLSDVMRISAILSSVVYVIVQIEVVVINFLEMLFRELVVSQILHGG